MAYVVSSSSRKHSDTKYSRQKLFCIDYRVPLCIPISMLATLRLSHQDPRPLERERAARGVAVGSIVGPECLTRDAYTIYYTILYYTILYYAILYYTILCYTILYYYYLSRSDSSADSRHRAHGRRAMPWCFWGHG